MGGGGTNCAFQRQIGRLINVTGEQRTSAKFSGRPHFLTAVAAHTAVLNDVIQFGVAQQDEDPPPDRAPESTPEMRYVSVTSPHAHHTLTDADTER